VSVSGDVAVIGAADDDNANGFNAGSAYIFNFDFPVLGDATGDLTLSSLDASWILEFDMRVRTGIDEGVADVNGDGDVSAHDASWV